ncbi:alpha/beta hydrolase family protein [Streptantibioticus cattleyicolor]|nr:Platelet-activating factor acetylhydrolase plasma/isoform II [Streptantibioticus cattleyicolor]CCB72226.1 Platelet-activating factor acetylhydrolase, plasma/intracellular isoform II [Streptantibioticus cattleyicolor NRRL 8057 = DSM 46488]
MTSIRRAAVAAALALVLPLPIAAAAPAFAAAPSAEASAGPAPVGFTAELPRPTGPYAVGRDLLHLVDQHRRDPWVPSAGARQLMVSMYYPARPGSGVPASYMTTDEARLFLQEKAPGSGIPPEALTTVRAWARTDARPAPGRFPLVLLSPGFTLPRALFSSVAEDLASRGYVVALIDHTYETPGVTFPDGQTLPCAICDQPPTGGLPAVAESRAKDASFVIDRLTSAHSPWSYAHLIDRRRIGMAGHSIGGDAAAVTMAADRRVRAGVNMDGTFQVPVPTTGLDGRPFLLFGAQSDESPGMDSSWDDAWTSLDGWKRRLTIAGAEHGTFSDLPLLSQAVGRPSPPGAIAPLRGLAITRTYLGDFFDLQLKGEPEPLLDGPSPDEPEVAVQLP